MKKNSNSQTKTVLKTKPAKARGPVQRESKEVMAELLAKLSERLEQKPAQADARLALPRIANDNMRHIALAIGPVRILKDPAAELSPLGPTVHHR